MIKALVFDFGGVMTTTITPFRVKEIVERKGLPWEAVLHGFRTYRREYDIGDITVEQFYDRVWSEAGVTVAPEIRREIEAADTSSYLYRNEATFAWMRELKDAGYRLAILTNMPNELAPHFKERFADFIALAETTVISSEVRLVKPMREIYDIVTSRLALAPEEICFFDDSGMNCRGASDVGWRAIQFVGIEAAKREFAEMSK